MIRVRLKIGNNQKRKTMSSKSSIRYFIYLLVLAVYPEFLFAAEMQVCSEKICLRGEKNSLSISSTSGELLKNVSLTSSIEQIIYNGKRFYLITDGFLYAVTGEGSLESKLQIFFKPQTIYAFGDTAIIKQSKGLEYNISHTNSGMVLKKIKRPEAEQELFIGKVQEPASFAYFYSDKLVMSDGKEKSIVLLGTTPEQVTYIDDNNAIIQRDRAFKIVEPFHFMPVSIADVAGFEKKLRNVSLVNLEHFLQVVENHKLKDELLALYAKQYLPENDIRYFRFLLKTTPSDVSTSIAYGEVLKQFGDFDDAKKREHIETARNHIMFAPLVVAYGKTAGRTLNKEELTFLFNQLPLSASFNRELLNQLTISILEYDSARQKLIAEHLAEKELIKKFIFLLLKDLPAQKTQQFEFAEKNYKYLSPFEKEQLAALLLEQFKTRLIQHTIAGDESVLSGQLVKLIESEEFIRLTRLIGFKLSYEIDFREREDDAYIGVELALNKYVSLVDIELKGDCTLKKSHEEEGKYTRNFLYFIPVADVEALFKVDEYNCVIDKKSIAQLEQLTETFKQYNVIIENTKLLRDTWDFVNKTVITELKVTPNAIGEALVDVANGSGDLSGFVDCQSLSNNCKTNLCSHKKDFSFEISFLDESDRSLCRDDCGDLLYDCKQHDTDMTKAYLCSALCRGSDDYYECKEECTDDNKLGQIIQTFELQD